MSEEDRVAGAGTCCREEGLMSPVGGFSAIGREKQREREGLRNERTESSGSHIPLREREWGGMARASRVFG